MAGIFSYTYYTQAAVERAMKGKRPAETVWTGL
jgi:hypothetical protein